MADQNNPSQGNQPQGQGGMQTNPYTGSFYGPAPQHPAYNYPQGQPYPYGYAGAQGMQPYGGAPGLPQGAYQQPYPVQQPVGRPEQQSFIENILRMNAGEVATVYMSFENDAPWANKVFKGVIEAAGKDHLILRDLKTTERYLLLMVYLNFVTFPNQINYYTPYSSQFYSVAE